MCEHSDDDDVSFVAITWEHGAMPQRLLDAMALAVNGAAALPVHPARVLHQYHADDPDYTCPRPLSMELCSQAIARMNDAESHEVSNQAVGQAELDLRSGRWLSV